MATTRAAPFEDLTKLASDFVTSQKGMWDHAAWKDFLSRIQKDGVELSEDMHSKLGDLLEAMKEYHTAVSSNEDMQKAMSTVFNECVAFIKRQKGVWGHAEWEDFVKTMQQNTHTWTEGMEAYLGGVLESLKGFYRLSPAVPAEKAAPASPAAPAEKAAPASPAAPAEKAAPASPAVPAKKAAPAAPRKASRKPSAATTKKKSGKKKTV